jgi:hypothetical protein
VVAAPVVVVVVGEGFCPVMESSAL